MTLDASVYSRAAVDRARAAFEHLARIEVQRAEGRYLIRFLEPDPELAGVLVDEFANYALGCLAVSP